MDRFTTMATFIRVAELGSLSAAARDLGLTQPAVSQQVAGLERRLGTRLVNRTTRRLRLTEAGETYYLRAKRILEEVEEADDLVACLSGSLTGRLCIHGPTGFGLTHLAPIVVSFRKQHPDLVVELVLDDRIVDMVAEGVDVALRFGTMKDSTLLTRKLGTIERILVASPGYVAEHGSPETPEELARHEHMRFSWMPSGDDVPLIGPDGPVTVAVRSTFLANSAYVVLAAVQAGLGIGGAQRPLVQEMLDEGRLVRVMQQYVYPPMPMQVVYPPGCRSIPRKVRMFVDHLVESLRGIPGL